MHLDLRQGLNVALQEWLVPYLQLSVGVLNFTQG